MKETKDQRKFYTVYRGKQSRLRHVAYMRIGKIAAARLLLERNGIELRAMAIFDYGFGPGTFFLHCDRSCRVAGVELDPVNVEAVARMLRRRGYENVDLAAVKVTHWNEHRLLYGRYDLILLSHVLEHLDDPVAVLQRLDDCLPDHGMILGLLPLNEITPDENHKFVCDRALVEKWAAEAGYTIEDYIEVDHYVYYTLPVFQAKGRLGRVAAQALSLGLGIAASCMTPRTWFSIGERAGKLIGTKPTQAVFLLKPVRARAQ